jgi:predicted GNAT family acetyltransferase
MTARTPIRHEPAARRFALDLDGGTAYITYRAIDERVLDFDHTFVPPPLRGGGIASRLAAHALQHARDHGYRVVPSCPFVAAFVNRHPEYRALLT